MSSMRDSVLQALETGRAIHVDHEAKRLMVEPKKIRDAIDSLRKKGYCIKNEGHGTKMFKPYRGC